MGSLNSPYVRYIWDPNKDEINLRKHRLALEDGIPALEDPNAKSWVDILSEGELRYVTVGMAYPNVLLVITSESSEDVTRIISVRRAEPHEENWYRYGHT